jgi:hypothetical protein
MRHAPGWLRERIRPALAAGIPGARALASTLVESAQRHSERAAFEQRRQVLHADTWIADSLAFAGASLER